MLIKADFDTFQHIIEHPEICMHVTFKGNVTLVAQRNVNGNWLIFELQPPVPLADYIAWHDEYYIAKRGGSHMPTAVIDIKA